MNIALAIAIVTVAGLLGSVILVLAAVIVIAVVARGRKRRKQENPAENEGGEE